MTITPSRPALRWHGGKFLLAPWIISHFAPHRIYAEPYSGAASVLLRKPRSYAELINDLDGEVVNLFRVLQSPADAAELERLLRVTPFARLEFERAYEPAGEPVERARRMLFRSFAGHGAVGATGRATGFRCNTTRSGTTPAHDWAGFPDVLKEFTARLQGVVIESRPAIQIIQTHDTPETLFYVDPPYPFSTRPPGNVYRHEMTDADHRALAEALHALRGMVVLSGYACPLYDEELYPNWERVTRQAHAGGARDRTEVLWLNPAASQRRHQPALSLFEEPDPPQIRFAGADGAELRGIPDRETHTILVTHIGGVPVPTPFPERFAPEDWPGEGA